MSNYPSTTQVLQPWQNFSRVPTDILSMAQDRGKRIHQLCAAISQGLWVPTIPEDCAPYIHSFLGWFPIVQKVIAVEPELICHQYHFKGHPDLVCQIKGDTGLALIDYKSPRAQQKSWRLQIASYRHLALQKWPNIIRVGSLRLSPEGKPAKFDEHSGTVEADFSIFVSCLNAYKFFQKE